MKKRILSALLCLCMVLSLLPTAAWAYTKSEITVGGVTLDGTDGKTYWKNGNTSESGATGTETDWNVKFDSSTATLTLHNAVVTGADLSGIGNCGIYAEGGINLALVLEGTNTVVGGTATSGDSCGVYAGGALTISGNGSLTATGGTAGSSSYGINVAEGSTFTIAPGDGETVQVTAKTTATTGTHSAFSEQPTFDNAYYAYRTAETGFYTFSTATAYTWSDSQTYAELKAVKDAADASLTIGTDSYKKENGNTCINLDGKWVHYCTPDKNGGVSLCDGFGYGVAFTDKRYYGLGENKGSLLYEPTVNDSDVTTAATVTLKNAIISAGMGTALYLPINGNGAIAVTLRLEGDNTLTGSSEDALCNANSGSTLTITGSGTLTLNGGLCSYSPVTVTDGASVQEGGTGFLSNMTVESSGSLIVNSDATLCYQNCSLTVESGGKLTIEKGGTLDWQAGLNDLSVAPGTVENNGTIILPSGTAPSAIPTNLNGKVKIDTNTYLVYDGKAYKLSTTDLTSTATGLNLDITKGGTLPTENTAYKAGDGYVLFTPAAGTGEAATTNTLTLRNAAITSSVDPIFRLPQTDVDIRLVGTNTLTSTAKWSDAFKQSESIDAQIKALTVTGGEDSSLTINVLSSGFNCGSGALTIGGDAEVIINDLYECPHDLIVTDNANLTTGSVQVIGGLTVSTAGDVNIPFVCMNFGTSGGTLSDNGKLNALVMNSMNYTIPEQTFTVYGDCTLTDSGSEINGNAKSLTVPVGAKLTIPADKTLKVVAIDDHDKPVVSTSLLITNSGTLENNGVLMLPDVYPEYNHFESMSAAIKALNLTGTGVVRVYTDTAGSVLSDTYTNDGTKVVYRTEALNFTYEYGYNADATLENDGYSYKSDGKGGYTLTLGNLIMNVSGKDDRAITLPTNTSVNIVLTDNTVLTSGGEALYSANDTNNTTASTVTVSGGGVLSLTSAKSSAMRIGSHGQNLVITGGTISANGYNGGINCNSGNITISGGTVTATGGIGNSGISADNTLTISGGEVTAKGGGAGIFANNGVTISGGYVKAERTVIPDNAEYGAIYVRKSGIPVGITLTGMEIKSPKGASVQSFTQSNTLCWSIFNADKSIVYSVEIGPESPHDDTTPGYIIIYPNSSANTSGNTTAETVKNADGSETTTVTDKTTGTVTATTSHTDGTSTVVETKKDGTVTTTEKAANGVTAAVSTDKDGAVTSVTVTVPNSVKGAVDVEIPANLGESDGKVSAEVTYEDGTKEIVKGTYSDGKVSLTVGGSAEIEIMDDFVPLASALPFTDVPADAWYYDELLSAYNDGLFVGTSETTFSPDADMTRQQMWVVIERMAGETPANMDEARAWAMENGISDGANPANTLTREQFVAMLWRFAGSPKSGQDMSGYTDFDDVADYAKEAMRWAVENGIVSGTSDDTLSPTGSATRAQAAVILDRCYNIFGE